MSAFYLGITDCAPLERFAEVRIATFRMTPQMRDALTYVQEMRANFGNDTNGSGEPDQINEENSQ